MSFPVLTDAAQKQDPAGCVLLWWLAFSYQDVLQADRVTSNLLEAEQHPTAQLQCLLLIRSPVHRHRSCSSRLAAVDNAATNKGVKMALGCAQFSPTYAQEDRKT